MEIEEEKHTDETEIKSVDIKGKTFKLPKAEADALIQIRDEMVKGYNEVSARLNEITSKEEQARMAAAEASRRADALEAAKKGNEEEAERLFAQKYQDQISKYQNYSIRQAVKSALMSRDDIVKSAVDDALNQIVSTNKFELGDDFSVKSGEATVDQVVNTFVDSRDYLKLAKSNKPTNTPGNSKIETPKVDFNKALEKFIGE